jgi:hypothetical protein
MGLQVEAQVVVHPEVQRRMDLAVLGGIHRPSQMAG